MRSISEKIFDLIHDFQGKKKCLDKSSKKELLLYKKHLLTIKKIASQDKPDFDEMWNEIKSKSPKKDLHGYYINVLRYAAAVIVIASISLLAYYISYDISSLNPNNNISQVENIRNNDVSLILSNGEKISISNDNVGNLINGKDIQVCIDSNKTLNYIEKKSEKIQALKYNTIVVPRGAEYSVKLSDGSVVYLNSESKIKYPVCFVGNTRDVYLEGEAFFRVSKNKHKPFIVSVGDMKVQVLGTTFNINSYKENRAIATTLVEGKVKVSHMNKSLILKPNHQAILKDNNLTLKEVDASREVSWRRGRFNFRNKDLEYVMVQIERWYDVDIFFEDTESRNIIFTGVLKRDCDLDKILSVIQEVVEVKIRRKDKSIYIKKSSGSSQYH